MKILAFDTSTDVLTAGLYEDEKVLAQRNELLRLVSTGWTIDVDPRNII